MFAWGWRGGVRRGGYKEAQGNFWSGGDEYVHYLNYGVDFMAIYTCQNLSSCTL